MFPQGIEILPYIIISCNLVFRSLLLKEIFNEKMQVEEDLPPELIQEAYARFGLAYYHSECLHKELCNFFAISIFQSKEIITRPRLEERLSHAFSLSLGLVIEKLRSTLSDELMLDLDVSVKKRNFLAHHFWFERAHLMFTISGIDKMIEELDEMSQYFQQLDERCSQQFDVKKKQLGITDDIIRIALEECMAGKPWEPLPDKRKPKKQERLIRVWKVALPNDQKHFVFETEGGCFWQLCDVGLGWTYYDSIQENWEEKKNISQYLPALINPRPQDCKPWQYEFNLSKGAVLWVRPGSHPGTYGLGVRKKK